MNLLTAPIGFGIEKLRKVYISHLSPHDTMYKLLLNELDKIENKLDIILNSEYKTACSYLQLGSITNDINDFLACERNAINAFNLATDVKSKISCM